MVLLLLRLLVLAKAVFRRLGLRGGLAREDILRNSRWTPPVNAIARWGREKTKGETGGAQAAGVKRGRR
jgi:hypothetical protein